AGRVHRASFAARARHPKMSGRRRPRWRLRRAQEEQASDTPSPKLLYRSPRLVAVSSLQAKSSFKIQFPRTTTKCATAAITTFGCPFGQKGAEIDTKLERFLTHPSRPTPPSK